jgi:hypothetical protein
METIAAHCDSYCSRLSKTMRTARSMTSGEYLIAFFFIDPFSQMSGPPRFPGRFNVYLGIDVSKTKLDCLLLDTATGKRKTKTVKTMVSAMPTC